MRIKKNTTMKKIVLTVLMIVLAGIAASVNAQDCEAIVRPYFQANNINPDDLVAEKYEWRCQFSYNAFYITSQVPEGATVFNFSELTDLVTKEHPSGNITIDLNTFSYWQYDFVEFQVQDYHKTIYFRTGSRSTPYLALRCWDEIYDRTNHPEYYKQ